MTGEPGGERLAAATARCAVELHLPAKLRFSGSTDGTTWTDLGPLTNLRPARPPRPRPTNCWTPALRQACQEQPDGPASSRRDRRDLRRVPQIQAPRRRSQEHRRSTSTDRHVPPAEPKRRKRPEQLPDPIPLGWTEPHSKSGRQYRHGTMSPYSGMKCRCRHCGDSMAAYRAERRAIGKDSPRTPRHRHTDNQWFAPRSSTPPASCRDPIQVHTQVDVRRPRLLDPRRRRDIQVAKERLGHGSITTTEQYLGTLPE